MKRKDLEEDFPSHRFSRKSRRLDGDGELLSAMEEDPEPGTEVPPLPEHQLVPVTSISVLDTTISSPDDRALKLFNLSNSSFLRSTGSPEFPIIINSQLIPGLKEQLIWPENSDDPLAVIPWAAQSRPPLEASTTIVSRQIDSEDANMDMMEMEYSTDASSNNIVFQYGEGFHRWQQQLQQHRSTPYFPGPQNIPAPLTW